MEGDVLTHFYASNTILTMGRQHQVKGMSMEVSGSSDQLIKIESLNEWQEFETITTRHIYMNIEVTHDDKLIFIDEIKETKDINSSRKAIDYDPGDR